MRTEPDLVQLYKEEAAQSPLLTHEQVIEHARAIRSGVAILNAAGLERAKYLPSGGDDVVAELVDELFLDTELEAKVCLAYRAKQLLTVSNLRLVLKWSKKYAATSNLERLDLIQEGNLGLMHAVDLFDYEKGFKFSTYASWWIKQYMQRAVERHNHTIRWPNHFQEKLRVHDEFIGKYVAAHGVDPTIDEVAAWLELSSEKVAELRAVRNSTSAGSLDTPLGDEKDSGVIGDLVASELEGPEDLAISALGYKKLAQLVDRLSERQQYVIREHFLGGRRVVDVAAELGVSSGTVSRLQRMAIRDLKHWASQDGWSGD